MAFEAICLDGCCSLKTVATEASCLAKMPSFLDWHLPWPGCLGAVFDQVHFDEEMKRGILGAAYGSLSH